MIIRYGILLKKQHGIYPENHSTSFVMQAENFDIHFNMLGCDLPKYDSRYQILLSQYTKKTCKKLGNEKKLPQIKKFYFCEKVQERTTSITFFMQHQIYMGNSPKNHFFRFGENFAADRNFYSFFKISIMVTNQAEVGFTLLQFSSAVKSSYSFLLYSI